MLAGLLGAAVGVPYAIDNADKLPGGFQNWGANSSVANADPQSVDSTASFTVPQMSVPEMPVPDSPGDLLYTSPAPLEGIPTYSLAEVLRMDVTKEWIYSRWSRKSTGLAEADLFGVRVPLVSGTRMTDVAGSLTYYFNVRDQIEKIRLTGKTADTTELANLLAQRYGFQQATPTLAGEQLFRVERKGRVESQLRTWPEAVLWATSPHDSFSIDLEINRAGSGRYVVRKPPKLEAIEQPANPPPPLFGQQQPAGTPILPFEAAVPTTNGVKAQQVSAQAKQEAEKAKELVPPPKVPRSQLRWPN